MSEPGEPVATPPDPMAGLRIREAVRAILLTPDRDVLLVRFEFPNTGLRWAMPGGGLEPGETHAQALRRELAEEVGLLDPPAGTHVWDRLHIIPFIDGQWDGQRERFFLVPTERFEPRPHLSWPELHAEYLFELRWWHLDEIADGLPFVPAGMAGHLRRLALEGPPNSPVEVGV
ncbi:MAG: NUDIX domain-containing protein [Ilumatobacteraceae bacterium]